MIHDRKEIEQQFPIGTKVRIVCGMGTPPGGKYGEIIGDGVVTDYFQKNQEGEFDGEGYYTTLYWALVVRCQGQKEPSDYIREPHEVKRI